MITKPCRICGAPFKIKPSRDAIAKYCSNACRAVAVGAFFRSPHKGQRITQDRLKRVLSYDPGSGEFTRLVRRGNCAVGSVAGRMKPDGYIQIQIDGFKYSASRLAWFYMTGEWPMPECDHRDTNRANNRWLNLRQATRSQNKMNSNKRADSKFQFKGVKRSIRGKPFGARIWLDGKTVSLGSFNTEEEAAKAYRDAAAAHYGEFARS